MRRVPLKQAWFTVQAKKMHTSLVLLFAAVLIGLCYSHTCGHERIMKSQGPQLRAQIAEGKRKRTTFSLQQGTFDQIRVTFDFTFAINDGDRNCVSTGTVRFVNCYII